MNTTIKTKPVAMMTGEDIIYLVREAIGRTISPLGTEKRLVYGLSGIGEIFKCSQSTAARLKKSGILDPAITQVGRKIIIDADLALSLVGRCYTPLFVGYLQLELPFQLGIYGVTHPYLLGTYSSH